MTIESIQTIKAIKKALKENFKDTKFKVDSNDCHVDNGINISWDDGPTNEQVMILTNKCNFKVNLHNTSRLYAF